VVYESDRDFGNLEQNPTSVTKPDCHDPPSTKIHSLSQMPDISDVSEKSKSKLTPVTGCREGYLQVATGKTTRVLISLSGVLSQIDVNGGYKTPWNTEKMVVSRWNHFTELYRINSLRLYNERCSYRFLALCYCKYWCVSFLNLYNLLLQRLCVDVLMYVSLSFSASTVTSCLNYGDLTF